jgi:glycosyltransferase involved in cell wall biosynthesis
VAARAGAVVAAGPSERRIVIAAGLAPAARVHVLRPRLDLAWAFAIGAEARRSARAALGVAPAAFCVVTACRLDRPRDLPLLLDAFANLAREMPSARLLVAGDGPDRPAVLRGIASRGLAGRASLLGHLADVGPLFAAADVFALTSRGWEGLPTAALEAAAAGLPVVLSAAGGAADALVDGESGRLVPRGDAAAWARVLGALAGDPERRRRMGARGRAFAAGFCDPTSMARDARTIYAEAVAASSS